MPITNRGEHPDFDEHGNLRPDAGLPPEQRDFNRMVADPAKWGAFWQNVTRWQSQLPLEVQRDVQGRTYGAGLDPYTGFRQYREAVDQAKTWYRGGEFTSDDISRMSLEEYDRHFDERGRPREGFSFRPTNRDVVTDDQHVDQRTRDELRRRGQER